MNSSERLVHMANQIARNLECQGPALAAAALARHMISFWDPRMRVQLLAMRDPPLHAIAQAAVALLREESQT